MASTLITAYLGQGLLAARPATPTLAAGTIGWYYATDTGVMSRYANGAWADFGNGIDLFAPPKASAFPTIVNGGSASPAPSVTDTSYGMLFDSGPTQAADNIRAALQPIPNATTFTTIVGMRTTLIHLPYRQMGLVLYDGTKLICFGQIGAGSLQVNYMTNSTTFSSSPISLSVSNFDIVYYKIQGDGTNLKFSFSLDGRNWVQILSALIGAHLSTITKVGVGGNANANTTPPAAGDHCFADVFYWSSTTP